jgi:hypothetical protein
MIRTHHGQHGSDCFGCKLATVQWTSMSPRAEDVRKRDREFEKDAAAYKRLRAEGLQPKGVDKSAMLEKMADHKQQVQLGRPLYQDELKAHNRSLGPI